MKTSDEPLYRKPTSSGGDRFKTFEDLEAYQLAREFHKAMYDVSRGLPDFEKFELARQIRRAAVSLTNNIAEGHGWYHYLEQIKFCLQSRGSLEEPMDDLNVCEDESYLPAVDVARLRQQGWHVHKLLAGYIRRLRQHKQGADLALHESSPTYGLTEDELDEILSTPAPKASSTLQPFNPSTL